ncbi:hypothetical protein PTQ19_03245 [Microbacterium esteraromaticum]|uniref:hypothetical protein n=1 Tax=Microbacterium esteraromaticum TaxID=57043 RepID=UPI0023682D4E|nr:hypothetical protein [Microbacterium esteraromaticum]WDH79470.1 hypothetical protein PTQ19_03245 [Microbacterium esteraromaticum]
MSERQPQITIGMPTIVTLGDRTRWSVPVSGEGLPEVLWYSIPTRYADMLCDRADAAVIALMIPSMHLRAPITVEGVVTDELVAAFSEIQALYAENGRGAPQPLTTSRTSPARPRAEGVATGYSGGVDSFAVLATHHYAERVPETQRVTHLLFNNVGSHGWGPEADALARERLARLSPSVHRIGLPLIDIDSNLDAFYAPPLWFFLTHTPRNVSVAYLLSRGIGTWLYASAFDYRAIAVQPGAAALVDPIALGLFSTTMLTTRDSGGALRRVDKTAMVADIPLSWEYLDVCSNIETASAQQCSDCKKCRRTLLALEVLGVSDRYRSIFDLNHWATIREAYLWEVLTDRDDLLMAELRELITQRGYRVPRRVIIHAVPAGWRRIHAFSGRVQRAVVRRYRRVIRR